jgi:hypothetical protein
MRFQRFSGAVRSFPDGELNVRLIVAVTEQNRPPDTRASPPLRAARLSLSNYEWRNLPL